MIAAPNPLIEPFRVRTGEFGTDPSDGNNGMFVFKRKTILIVCIVSDQDGWDHVSIRVRRPERTPTWEEMCWIKDRFFRSDECVMQLHPPEEDYVNLHAYVLHLWRPHDVEIPRPPSIMVGFKGEITCPACEGEGEYVFASGAFPGHNRRACTVCKGTGKIGNK